MISPHRHQRSRFRETFSRPQFVCYCEHVNCSVNWCERLDRIYKIEPDINNLNPFEHAILMDDWKTLGKAILHARIGVNIDVKSQLMGVQPLINLVACYKARSCLEFLFRSGARPIKEMNKKYIPTSAIIIYSGWYEGLKYLVADFKVDAIGTLGNLHGEEKRLADKVGSMERKANQGECCDCQRPESIMEWISHALVVSDNADSFCWQVLSSPASFGGILPESVSDYTALLFSLFVSLRKDCKRSFQTIYLYLGDITRRGSSFTMLDYVVPTHARDIQWKDPHNTFVEFLNQYAEIPMLTLVAEVGAVNCLESLLTLSEQRNDVSAFILETINLLESAAPGSHYGTKEVLQLAYPYVQSGMISLPLGQKMLHDELSKLTPRHPRATKSNIRAQGSRKSRSKNKRISLTPSIEECKHLSSAVAEMTLSENSDSENELKSDLKQAICPITLEPMIEPVVTCDGHVYERDAIEAWFKRLDTLHPTSPLTGLELDNRHLEPFLQER